MAIRAECGACGRVYNLKDELDGRKIRCKDCQSVVLVQAEDVWDESIDEEEFQPPVRNPKPKKKAKRRSSGPQMPVSIMIALSCLAVMIGLSLLEAIGAVTGITGDNLSQAARAGKVTGIILRGLIQIAVFWGVLKGTASTVTPSIIMAILTILISGGAAVVILLASGDALLTVIVICLVLLRVIYVICMLTPSAKDYMRN